MLKLYHCPGARSLRTLWMLEELGLAYELESLPFPPRFRHKPYLAVNPLGTVPALFDGESAVMESAGSLHYLAQKYGPTPLAVQADEPDFAAWVNFLHMGEATLTHPLAILVRYRILEKGERRLEQAAVDSEAFFLGRLNYVEQRLEGRDHLAADRFTAADISVGYAISLAIHLKLEAKLPPRARDYWDRLQQRPAYQRAAAL